MTENNCIWESTIGTREENQDSLRADFEKKIFLMADGMGGRQHAAGAEASDLTTYYLMKKMLMLQSGLERGIVKEEKILRRISRAIGETNQVITSIAKNVGSLSHCGTTLDTCMIYNNKLYGGHVGDGAVYIANIQDDTIEKLTTEEVYLPKDISQLLETEQQVLKGESDLTNYIGKEPNINVELYEKPFKDGDILIMGTDGFTSMVAEEEILGILYDSQIEQNIISRIFLGEKRTKEEQIKEDLRWIAENPIMIRDAYDSLSLTEEFNLDITNKLGDNITFMIYGRIWRWQTAK